MENCKANHEAVCGSLEFINLKKYTLFFNVIKLLKQTAALALKVFITQIAFIVKSHITS